MILRTSYPRAATLAVLLLVGGCNEKSFPFGPDSLAQLQLTFDVSPDGGVLDPSALDAVRLVAIETATGDTLGSRTTAWSGRSGPWTAVLDVLVHPSGPSHVRIEVEVLSGSSVEWSGRSVTVEIPMSEEPVTISLALFRGPLANLSVTDVSLDAHPSVLEEGDDVSLDAQLTLADPALVSEARVFWTSSDPSIASVSAAGTMTGLLPGTVSIVAWAGPLSDSTDITVTAAPSSVLLSPTATSLASLGEQIAVAAAVVDARGDTLGGYAIDWTSTDPAVLGHLGGGTFRAVATGSADVVATVSQRPSVQGSARIQVAQQVARATLDPDTIRFASLGDQRLPSLTVEDALGNPVPSPTVLWSTSDPGVATVGVNGTVTAQGNGVASISAEVSGPGSSTRLAETVVHVSQVATAVTLIPGDLTLIGPGLDIALEAEAFDANGNAISGPSFSWSSSDPSVASISAGVASTVGQGVTEIRVSLDGVSATSTLTVLTSGGVTLLWLGGSPGAEEDWGTPANWFPERVPTVADTILVPASAPDQPRLDIDWQVAGAVLESGSSLDLAGSTLALTSDLAAGNTVLGPGTIHMSGSGSISGSIPNLLVTGATDLAGPVSVTGDLQVAGPGATLMLGSQQMSVSGGLLVQDGAALTMLDAGGLLDVDGAAVFDGRSTQGLLTAGELRVAGNFTAWTSDNEAFAPTGSHRTVFDGGVIQTAYLHFNDLGEGRFQHLEVDNPGGVILSSTTRIEGDLHLQHGPLTGAQTVHLGGNVTVAGAGTQYQVLNTILAGPSSLPPSMQTNLTVAAPVALSEDVQVDGDVMIDGVGSDLAIGGEELTITGVLRTMNGGTLTMQDPGGLVSVAGDVVFDGGSTDGLLTAGELSVGGDLTAWLSEPTNLAPSVGHTVVLSGTTPQTVYLHHNDPGEARFHHLEIDNAAGASLASTTRVTGDISLTLGTLDGSQTVYVAGDLSESVGGNQYRVLNTVFLGSPALPLSLQTNATFASPYTLTRDLEVLGDLNVSGAGAGLDVGANRVTVSGDFRTADGGTLTMTDVSGEVEVAGEVEFNGGSTDGLLTAGELSVGGNFTAWTSHSENFAPTGSHRTVLDGSSAQAVYLYFSGMDQAHFQDLLVENPAGATLFGTTRVEGDLTLSSSMTVGLGQVTLVAGLFTLEAAATLVNDGSLQANSCSLLGTVIGNAPICP